MLGPSAPSFQRQVLQQIDNVGQNDKTYDGKEHQDENIQHCAVLG
jgi:hypothetical protein